MNKSPGRLRAIGLIEGVSYLLLLGIAMPLKYYADEQITVFHIKIVIYPIILLRLPALPLIEGDQG
jgi:hypothetical protein